MERPWLGPAPRGPWLGPAPRGPWLGRQSLELFGFQQFLGSDDGVLHQHGHGHGPHAARHWGDVTCLLLHL